MSKKKFSILFSSFVVLLLLFIGLYEKKSPSQTLSGMVIVLDPGHGGKDNGAEGQDTIEKKLTLQTAKKLKKALNRLGATVLLTRDNDTFISLEERVTFAEEKNADLFMSIHYNSSPAEEPNGITTYYYDDKWKNPLATTIHNYLIEETKANDRHVLFGDFLVLRDNSVPSILLELGFLSNKNEEKEINRATYQENLVKAICDGIITHKEKEHKLSKKPSS